MYCLCILSQTVVAWLMVSYKTASLSCRSTSTASSVVQFRVQFHAAVLTSFIPMQLRLTFTHEYLMYNTYPQWPTSCWLTTDGQGILIFTKNDHALISLHTEVHLHMYWHGSCAQKDIMYPTGSFNMNLCTKMNCTENWNGHNHYRPNSIFRPKNGADTTVLGLFPPNLKFITSFLLELQTWMAWIDRWSCQTDGLMPVIRIIQPT